ncbi:MAG TPA: fibronectin type III domain-containing protein [Bacteroidales bacterium]
MRKVRVLLDFIKYIIPVKIECLRKVLANLTSNATVFPTPDVELTVLKGVLDKLDADYLASLGGSHVAIAQMHQSEAEVDEKFRIIAKYVDRIANGNESIILIAGFNPTRQPVPSLKDHFTAKNSANPGEIILRYKAQPNARSYTWQYSEVNPPVKEEDWKYAGSSTKAKFTIRNLVNLTKYWFRVAPVTAQGMQPWSEPISKVAM